MENLLAVNTDYEAGVCNIGPAEISKRKRYFLIALLGSAVFTVMFYFLDPPQIWKFTFIGPLFAVALTFLQVRYKFCVTFGFLSVVNFGDITNRQRIKNVENHQKDLRKVRIIFIQSIAFAILTTILIYFLT